MTPQRPHVKTDQDQERTFFDPIWDFAAAHPKAMCWLILVNHINLILNLIGVYGIFH
jgi:hypothetical protein